MPRSTYLTEEDMLEIIRRRADGYKTICKEYSISPTRLKKIWEHADVLNLNKIPKTGGRNIGMRETKNFIVQEPKGALKEMPKIKKSSNIELPNATERTTLENGINMSLEELEARREVLVGSRRAGNKNGAIKKEIHVIDELIDNIISNGNVYKNAITESASIRKRKTAPTVKNGGKNPSRRRRSIRRDQPNIRDDFKTRDGVGGSSSQFRETNIKGRGNPRTTQTSEQEARTWRRPP